MVFGDKKLKMSFQIISNINIINTKVNMRMILNKVMVNLYGLWETNIVVIIKMMREMVGGIWNGLIKVYIWVNGIREFNKVWVL